MSTAVSVISTAARKLADAAGAEPIHTIVERLPGSPCEKEYAEAVGSKMDIEIGLEDAQKMMGLLYFAVVDHLRSLANAVSADTITVLGPAIACRSGLEASCRLYYLADPTINMKTRVQRAQSLHIRGMRYRMKALDAADVQNDIADRIARRVDEAERWGIEVTTNKAGVKRLAAQAPGDQQLVREARERWGETDGGVLYHYLSGLIHGETWTLFDHLEPPDAHTAVGAFPAVTQQRLADLAAAQLETSGDALGYFTDWVGVDPAELASAWLDGLEAILRLRPAETI